MVKYVNLDLSIPRGRLVPLYILYAKCFGLEFCTVPRFLVQTFGVKFGVVPRLFPQM